MPETNTKPAAGNGDLPDIRPPQGEYFYTDDSLSNDWGRGESCKCFVCGEKITFSSNSRHVRAVAECTAAGKRIVSMFKPETCHDPEPFYEGGVRITVSACQGHRHNADILCRLTADGIITPGKISRAENSTITPEEFHEFVAKEARAIWDLCERERRHRNWCDSWRRCLSELGHIPSLSERTACAKRLSEERSGRQAEEDWLIAEKKVGEIYNVAPIDDP